MERNGAGGKKRHLQIGEVPAFDGTAERKPHGKLKFAIAAKLPGVQQPGLTPIRDWNQVGGEELQILLHRIVWNQCPPLPMNSTLQTIKPPICEPWFGKADLPATLARWGNPRQAFF